MQRLLLRRAGWLALPGVLIFAVVFIGCSDAPPATPEASPPEAQAAGAETADTDATTATEDTEAGPPATPETVPEEPDPAPASADEEPESAPASADEEPEPAAAEAASEAGPIGVAIVVDDGTVWQDVFDGLSAGEQSCIRDAVDEAALEAALATSILETDVPEPWEVAIFSCLAPEIARALFVSVMVAEMETDEGVELSGEEESCLRDWSADVDVAALIAVAAVDDSAATAEFMPGVVQCIPDLMLAAMLLESGVPIDELSENEVACLRTWLVDLDWAALMTGPSAEDAAAAVELAAGMFSCAPSLFVSAMIAESGLALEELGEEEAACLREWADATDWATVMVAFAAADMAGLSDVMPGLMRCLPVVFVSAMIAEAGAGVEALSEAQATCVRAWAAAADWSAFWNAFSADDPTMLGEFLPGLIACVPQVFGLVAPMQPAAPAVPVGPDAVADTLAEAMAVVVGATTPGAVNHDGDADVFVVELEAGRLYQVDVELITLDDSVATLYGRAGEWLAENDDHAGTGASRFYWRAAQTGPHYVEVTSWGGAGTGEYVLTIALLDIVDDHADTAVEATPATLGEATPGALQYSADVDFFVIELEAGRLYQIDVTPGTLADPTATLYGDEGEWLAGNDNYADSPAARIYWRPSIAGAYYVAVETSPFALGEGSYILTAAVSELVDDHGDTAAEATPAPIGDAITGTIDYPGDVDVFVLDLIAGRLYQIDVMLGTLPDSVASLFGEDDVFLASNDDHQDSRASRIYWEAIRSGPHYLEVAGFGQGVGTYTLTTVERQ